MSSPSISPSALASLPADARKWLSIALAVSVISGAVTGSIVTIINATNSTAKSSEIAPIKEQLDRIETQHRLTAEATRAQGLQLRHVATWICQENVGAPTPGWPCEPHPTWDPAPAQGRDAHHLSQMPWPVPREIVVVGSEL